MTTRKHVRQETFDADARNHLRATAHSERDSSMVGASHAIVDQKEGGVWVALWGDEDAPEFITAGRMSLFDPPRRLKFSDFEYYARSEEHTSELQSQRLISYAVFCLKKKKKKK